MSNASISPLINEAFKNNIKLNSAWRHYLAVAKNCIHPNLLNPQSLHTDLQMTTTILVNKIAGELLALTYIMELCRPHELTKQN